jgi:hypothetical protein
MRLRVTPFLLKIVLFVGRALIVFDLFEEL